MRTIIAVAVFLIIAGGATARASEYEVWVRAFIPNQHDSNPGYVKPVPGRDGLAMIPGPSETFSDCFLTDQRGFSMEPSGPNVTSRIAAYAKFTESGQMLAQQFVPSQSVEVDCEDGEEECRNDVDTSRGAIGAVAFIGHRLSINLRGEANDACYMGAPDLDFDVTLEIDPAAGSVAYSGTIDEFPSFEALLRVDGGDMVRLFAIPPVPGSSAFAVLGSRTLPAATVEY